MNSTHFMNFQHFFNYKKTPLKFLELFFLSLMFLSLPSLEAPKNIFLILFLLVAIWNQYSIKDQFTFTVEATAVTTSETQVDPIKNSPTEPENKLSIYLILSVTAIVGGLLILVFIWKKQGK